MWLGLAYFRVSQRVGIGGKSSHNYPLCSDQFIGVSLNFCSKKIEITLKLVKTSGIDSAGTLHPQGRTPSCYPFIQRCSFGIAITRLKVLMWAYNR